MIKQILKYLFVFIFLISAWNMRSFAVQPSAKHSVSPDYLFANYVFAQVNIQETDSLQDGILDGNIMQGRYLISVDSSGQIIQTEPEGKEIPPLLVEIIKCESNWNPLAKNPNSTASGLAQFIASTWRSTMRKMGLPEDSNIFDYDLNLKAAIYLFNEQGTRPWLASVSCWLKQ